MTLEELYTAMLTELPTLAAQTFYDHIVIEEGDELVPPFIFFHEVDGTPFNADNRVYYIGVSHRIDVYIAERDMDLRRQIQGFLDSHDLGYTISFDDFDESMMLYRDSYTVELDE